MLGEVVLVVLRIISITSSAGLLVIQFLQIRYVPNYWGQRVTETA